MWSNYMGLHIPKFQCEYELRNLSRTLTDSRRILNILLCNTVQHFASCIYTHEDKGGYDVCLLLV